MIATRKAATSPPSPSPVKIEVMLGGNIMEKNCENCKQNIENAGVTIPYFAHESEMTRAERHIKRMWIALIVCIMLIFASNALWLWVWNSYEYYTEEYIYTQDGEGNNIIGDDNQITNNGVNDGAKAGNS